MKKPSSLAVAVLSVIYVKAQELNKGTDTDLNLANHRWYTSPWVWVIAAAVVIVLLVFFSRGGRRD